MKLLRYDSIEAKRLAIASRDAYRDEGIISAGETQVTVCREKGRVTIAFRGTEASNIKDWLTDLRIVKTDFYGLKVHKGFCSAYYDIRAAILSELAEVPVGVPIYVTGHSLGAGLATLCAFDLSTIGNRVAGLYTFGSPRVGGGQFKRAFNLRLLGKSFRVVNHSDIVCRVPTLLRWRHVGEVVYFDEAGVQRPAPPFWYGYREMWGNITSHRLGDSFTDHSIDGYIKLLER